MKVKKIIVVFKTHLDIGFTDFSSNVTEKYLNEYIPNAIRVANQFREEGGNCRLVWTTGSWLIREYLRQKKDENFIKAINNGDICWHGLPFTTHTELMSADLFKYGLSISKELDKQFGKKTISAKLTDVPGHTKSIIPYLREAGIEFLHIGVNPASAVPCVPPLFKWKHDDGRYITVMYHDGYGNFSIIPDTGIAVCFAHTGDNAGVQTAEQIKAVFSNLRYSYPDADIVSGNLNDVALAVREVTDRLPVLTDEIGDTWIHGTGTDPLKISSFKNLEKFWKSLPNGKDKEKLGSALLMIPEHTWGLNVHLNLGDHEIYDRDSFIEFKKSAGNFIKMEKSWQEQRNYIFDAVNRLNDENRKRALCIISNAKRDIYQKGYSNEIPFGTKIDIDGFKIIFNRQGEIISLANNEKVLADKKHRLCTIVYEQFCADDYKRFFTQYNRCEETWAYEDYTKPGIERGSSCYCRFEPERASVYLLDNKLLVRYSFPDEAHKKYGCPLAFDLLIEIGKDMLSFDLAWFCKPANRVAEAVWFGFRPIAKNKRIIKLGKPIDPKQVVRDGQCRLHATDFGVKYDELSIESIDVALVAPQEPSLLNFCNDKPNDDDGIYFNLYNNVWGTNFPMWYDENARFRFLLHL